MMQTIVSAIKTKKFAKGIEPDDSLPNLNLLMGQRSAPDWIRTRSMSSV